MYDKPFKWEIGAQARCQITVKLNHMQGRTTFKQRSRECAGSGADLDQSLAWLGVKHINDALHDIVVMQEMLTEALLGLGMGHIEYRP